ncbi:hypothetical protein VN97_g6334, partial [Penicillium thymicola]
PQLPLSFLCFFSSSTSRSFSFFYIHLRLFHQVIDPHTRFVTFIPAKMVAWTRFKLLLAMVTTMVTMVAASAECYDVETVFLQDPNSGEQYQFGEGKSISLFGSTLKSAVADQSS